MIDKLTVQSVYSQQEYTDWTVYFMTLTLLASLTGIALIDSLNPSLFFAQFVLFTMSRPVERILLYIAGVLTANFIGGWLILNGVRAAIADVLASAPGTLMYGIGAALGVIALLFGALYRPKTTATIDPKRPRSTSLLFSYFFGMIVMVNELTTALPYFVAIEQIGAAQLNAADVLLALVLYNLIFSLPLFAFLGGYIVLRGRFTTALDTITRWTLSAAPRLAKGFAIVLGGVLVVNAAAFFATGVPVF